MQRLEAGAEAQETTGRILVMNPCPLHWPDLPHVGLEESCWVQHKLSEYLSSPRMFLPTLLGQEGGEKKAWTYRGEV